MPVKSKYNTATHSHSLPSLWLKHELVSHVTDWITRKYLNNTLYVNGFTDRINYTPIMPLL
jgi:hypothetical protein